MAGRKVTDFASLADIAPTFLEAAGLDVPPQMTGKSLMPVLLSEKSGRVDPTRDHVYTARERHTWAYADGKTYPMRALRKENLLLVWNMKPSRWPAGHADPFYNWEAFPFGDVDNGPSKTSVMTKKHTAQRRYFDRAFGKRPEYELYDVSKDPYQLNNLAERKAYADSLAMLKKQLKNFLTATNDLRMHGQDSIYRQAAYYCTKGYESGGLWLEEWQELSPKEQKAKQEAFKTTIKEAKEEVSRLYGEE